ncbi:hypothetical protein EDD25_2724 [Cryobacterium psychrophilum]|nr:hypothetical protein EDD25_2724 [Cryobacterium psychrophilum]
MQQKVSPVQVFLPSGQIPRVAGIPLAWAETGMETPMYESRAARDASDALIVTGDLAAITQWACGRPGAPVTSNRPGNPVTPRWL